MDSYHVCCGYDLHLDRSVVGFFFSIYVRYYGTACVYIFFVGSLCAFPRNCTMELH